MNEKDKMGTRTNPIRLGEDDGAAVYVIGIGDIGTTYYRVQDYGVCCLQDALDAIADHIEQQAWIGLLGGPEDVQAYYDESHPDHVIAQDAWIVAGNHGVLLTSEIHVIKGD